jgi:AcrR family transcriptional regulator
MEAKDFDCRRPYALGKRLDQSNLKRTAVLRAARAQIESGGYLNVTMESLARESGVTRQTVHNLFKTKAGVLEALFDEIAVEGCITEIREEMQAAMRKTDPDLILTGIVRVFTNFWTKDWLLLRRVHGIAALDPEFREALQQRNQRRQIATTAIVNRLCQLTGEVDAEIKSRRIAALYALTSFEFFDALAERRDGVQDAPEIVLGLARAAVGLKF